MRKTLIAVAAVLGLLIVAALAGPALYDWNQFKPLIAEKAREATGRELSIDGDISARILPSPALTVSGVRLSNAPGASAKNMAQLKSLSVGVAILPLLGGNIQVSGITLDEPVIELEALPGGGNWEMAPKGKDAAAKGAPEAGAAPAVRVDRLTVRNGRLTYRDAKAGTLEQVEKISAVFSAGSLQGPFSGRGDLVAKGFPVSFKFDTGAIQPGLPSTVTLGLGVAGGKVTAQFTGGLSELGKPISVGGRLKLESDNLAAALAESGGAVSPLLARRLSFETDIQASAAQAQAKDIRLSFGEIAGTGGITAALTGQPKIDATFQINAINLDKFLASGGAPTKPQGPSAPAAGAGAGPAGASKNGAGFAIPTGVNVRLDVAVAGITFGDAQIQNVKLQAALADGALSLTRAGFQAPGGTELALSGKLAAEKGNPLFTGRVDASVDNFRALAAALKIDLAQVPAERLRKLQLASNLRYDADSADLSGIDFKFDNSRLTGAASYKLNTARPTVGVDLALDRINVDYYLAAPAKPAAAGAPAKSAAGAAAGGNPLAALRAIDGDVRLRLGQATYGGKSIDDIDVDAALRSGILNVKRAAVGNFAGANASLAGKIDGAAERLGYDVKVAAAGKDVAQTARALGSDYRPAASNLGGFSFAATVQGDTTKARASAVKANVGPAAVEGDISVALDKARPQVVADLKASEIFVDLFLPASGPAASPLPAPSAPKPAAGGAARWSKERIDMDYLRALDADIGVAARGIQFANYNFKEPQLKLTLNDGVLEIKQLKGRLFNGAVDLKARVASGDAIAATVEYAITGADLKQAMMAALQMDRIASLANITGKFETRGASQLDLVRGLNGQTRLDARDGVVTGIDMKRLSDQMKNLNQVTDFLGLVGGALSGGQTRLAQASGTWIADKGVIRSNDTKAQLDSAEATVNGTIDLVNWQLDVVSRMRLTEHANAPQIGIDVRGSIDQPQRIVQTKELETYAVGRAGESILRKVLKQPAPATGATAPGAGQAQPAPTSPVDQLLKGIFKKKN
jgi:uncharacterized protein involved in outer membrane biogenesis